MGKFQKGNQIRKGKMVAPVIFEGRKLTKIMWEEAIHKYMAMSKGQLEALISDPGNLPAFEILVISILAKAVRDGDVHRAEFLLARLIGKVPDQINIKDVTNDDEIKDKTEELKRDYLAIVGKS